MNKLHIMFIFGILLLSPSVIACSKKTVNPDRYVKISDLNPNNPRQRLGQHIFAPLHNLMLDLGLSPIWLGFIISFIIEIFCINHLIATKFKTSFKIIYSSFFFFIILIVTLIYSIKDQNTLFEI